MLENISLFLLIASVLCKRSRSFRSGQQLPLLHWLVLPEQFPAESKTAILCFIVHLHLSVLPCICTSMFYCTCIFCFTQVKNAQACLDFEKKNMKFKMMNNLHKLFCLLCIILLSCMACPPPVLISPLYVLSPLS